MTTIDASAFQKIASASPSWLKPQREQAWDLFQSLQLPSRRDLEWQPFDLGCLKLDELSMDNEALTVSLTPLSKDLADQGVIFCDLAKALQDHPAILEQHLGTSITADESSKFLALHNALWLNGALLYVPRGVRVESALQVEYQLAGAHTAVFPRTLVLIEEQAEATLVQKFTGGPPATSNGTASLHASATEVFVKPGGHLHYVSMQNFEPRVFDVTRKRARVGRDAEIDWVVGMFGASFQRYDIECLMEESGGTSYMYGVGVGDQNQQFGQFTKQHHLTGHTVSDLLFKNVYRDRAVGNYAGTIKVEKNANETNAYQSNRNLVLSDRVRCDTHPILEIESNQLRCSHGATVGRLEPEQLFYLRSRGLDEVAARQMLIEAFTAPVLARIRLDDVRNEFANLIHQKVSRS